MDYIINTHDHDNFSDIKEEIELKKIVLVGEFSAVDSFV